MWGKTGCDWTQKSDWGRKKYKFSVWMTVSVCYQIFQGIQTKKMKKIINITKKKLKCRCSPFDKQLEKQMLLAESGKARGCNTNPVVIHSFTKSPSFSLRLYCNAKPKRWGMVRAVMFRWLRTLLISGSKVMVMLLNFWTLHIGGVVSGRGCVCRMHSRLVLWQT